MGEKARWVLPLVVDPPDSLCFQVNVPNDRQHIAAFYGAIFSLVKPYNWQNDNAHTAIQVGAVWGKVFDDLINQRCPIPTPNRIGGMEVEDFMPLRIDCDCNVFVTCCDGTEKQLLTGDQVKALIAGSGVAGAPQPEPNGGSACYDFQLFANLPALIPYPVSTGDVVTLQSIDGAGTDGAGAWYCPDGSNFFAGACLGGGILDGADPVPTASHMSIIVEIGGTFHSLVIGTPFTVPSGVSLVQPTVQVNDGSLSDNAGVYQAQVCVVNNAAGTWSHTFDLRLGLGGFTLDVAGDGCPGNAGAWLSGLGFSAIAEGGGGCTGRYMHLAIRKTWATSTTITDVEAVYSDAQSGNAGGSTRAAYIFNLPDGVTPALETSENPLVAGTNRTLIASSPFASKGLWLVMQIDDAGNGNVAGGSGKISQLTVKGSGFDPWL